MSAQPATVGELKDSGYQPRTVREEIRDNLIKRLEAGGPLFPEIHGYEDTVVPALENALLAEQEGEVPTAHEVTFRLLQHLASSVRHQQYHETDILTIRVQGRGLVVPPRGR